MAQKALTARVTALAVLDVGTREEITLAGPRDAPVNAGLRPVIPPRPRGANRQAGPAVRYFPTPVDFRR
ncbi:hypothetical protein GCM10009727_31690 [Actinomadura napierensis]|uniref:Uncharacterized protein n=1 Tax=Actinomadura napierensis TaxID=267854 RepID=A0ABN2Z4V7_9ACTN